MVSVETVSIVFTGLSISLAAFYYISTLRNANRMRELTLKAQELAIESRNTQFFMQLYSSTNDEDAIKMVFTEKKWDSFDEWWEQNGATNNPDIFARWFKMMYTHELFGLMAKRGFLDIEIIDDLMSGGILMIWDRYGPIVEGMREKYGYPQLQEHQEYLVNEIRKIVNKQHPNFQGKIQA
jgi:hypothetical protein